MLVKNLGERGVSGKLRSFWEDRIYVVREQVSDNPVYVVQPEGNNQGRIRALHQNLRLLVNDLSVEFPPEPAKPIVRPTCRQAKDRVRAKNREGRIGNAETSDSDDDSGSSYWVRIPPTWVESRTAFTSKKQPTSQNGVKPVRQSQPQSEKRSVQGLRGHGESGRGMLVTGADGIVEDLLNMTEIH